MTHQDESYARLLDALARLGVVTRPRPGWIELVDDLGRVTLVIGAGDFDGLAGPVFGSVDAAAGFVVDKVRDRDPALPYLVHDTYDLVGSETPDLPDEPMFTPEALAAMERVRAANPDAAFGWYAEAPGGTRRRFDPGPGSEADPDAEPG